MSIENLDQNTHGIISQDVKTAQHRHLVVLGAQPDSPAAEAGLKPGDVVVKIGEFDVIDAVDLERAFLGRAAGEPVTITVRRADQTESLSLALVAQRVGKSALNTHIVSRANNDDPETERVWSVLGLRMATLPSTQQHLVAPRYRGGMKVLDVKADSPAARNGIRKGDILVGLSKWETLSSENVTWILNQPTPASEEALKFYLIRGSETLYGHLQLASKQN